MLNFELMNLLRSSRFGFTCARFPAGADWGVLWRRVVSGILLLSALTASTASIAEEWVSGNEIKQLVKGAEVWAVKEGVSTGSSSLAIEQHGTHGVRFRFLRDGTLERSASGYDMSANSQGKWWVKKNWLCIKLDGEKKFCSTLGPLPDGKYRLYGKGGNPRKLMFNKITKQ